ncbi:hypothetical protein EL17_11515 [Anditalea andensis]|uniref:Uncharacterized protein n=1 Tax=Anditalea andensis TaxID=1048983 RepID=A0A074KZ89_9BACT|nr:hypothetical protein EL17_11515 [Anditalea andensis]
MIDAQGIHIWEWKSEGIMNSIAHAGYQTSNGFLLYGTYSNQTYIIQLNEDGELPPCVQLVS